MEATARSPAANKPPLFTWAFVSILLTQVCFGYAGSAFQMLPKFLSVELDAQPSQIGLLAACFGLASVLMTPLVGELVDRLGRRRCMSLGALLTALTSFAFVLVDSLGPLVYVLRAFQGAGFALAFVAGATLAVDHAPPERLAQALAFFGLTMLSMNAVGPVVTEELAGRVGWHAAFATAGCGALLCLLLVLLVLREAPRPPHDPAEPRGGLFSVMRQPRQQRLAVVNLLTAAACGVMFTFHQPFALSLGIERVGSFFAAYAAAAILVRVGLGGSIDRMGRPRVARVCLALYAVTVTGMFWLEDIGLVPFGALFGVAHGLVYPAMNAILVDGVGAHERGKVMALFIGAFNLGFALGPLGLGFLADARGFPPVFLVAGAFSATAFAIFLASPEGETRRRAARRATAPADLPGATGCGP